MTNIPTDCMTWRRFAPKIAKLLDVKTEQILLIENGISIIDTRKIADILVARGQFSWTKNERLKNCLNKHYKGVSELLERYWDCDLKMQRKTWLEQQQKGNE